MTREGARRSAGIGATLGMLAAFGGLGRAETAAQPAILALVVTNNHSADLGRPDLLYADDDGAKYYELFASIAGPDRVVLLTEFDRDTRRLFPELVARARPPTSGNLTASAARLARVARSETTAGREVDLYFVFAGHGDVDRGRGFIELADGPFYSEDLESLLLSIPATRVHVILDSCNSFFVINPRRPGGRRFSTPSDAGRNLAARMPHVGVFLSTSAEAEVFEWSELQSGIFSHAVRSGLAGAADANGDGVVSYEELEAFVDLAASRIRNPLYRPRVFARGPGGLPAAPVLDLRRSAAVRLRIEEDRPVRVSVRDRDQLRWIDTYKEAGASLEVRLPARLAQGFEVEELDGHSAGRIVLRRYRGGGAPEGDAILLSALHAIEQEQLPRGSRFRELFTTPYGPRAFAAYRAGRLEAPPPVYGISREDSERLDLLLRHTAAVDRQQRFFKAGAVAGGSLLLATGGLYLSSTAGDARIATADAQRNVGRGLALVGVLGASASVYWMLADAAGERAYHEFRRDLSDPDTGPARAVAAAEERLLAMHRAERRMRLLAEVSGWTVAGLGAAGVVSNEAFGPERIRAPARLLLAGTALSGVALALVVRTNITPLERMIEIWHDDPGIQRLPRVAVSPSEDGVVLGVGGAF